MNTIVCSRRSIRLAVVLAAVTAVTPASAQVAASPSEGSASALEKESAIRQWVRELDADRFETRQRAQEELIKAGSASQGGEEVIRPLMDAVVGGNLEVAMRALNILQELLAAPAAPTRAAAHEALEKLASSDNKAIAAKAASLVQPPSGNTRGAAIAGRGFPMGGVIIGGGKLQINVGDLGGQIVEFQAAGGKGQRSIHVRDNDRTVDIKDDTEGAITMNITERVNGKEQSRTIEAKDPAELKRKDPQAYELYEKHTAGKQMGAMNNGQFVLGGGLFMQGAPDAGAAIRSLAALEAELQTTRGSVQRLRAKAAAGKMPVRDLKPYLDQVENLRKQLAELENQAAR